MKTRKHLLTLLLAMAPLFAFSQQNGPLTLNKFWDNWFISAGGGLQGFVGEGSQLEKGNLKGILKDAGNFDNYTPAVTFSIGKMVTPVFGFRLQGYGWEVRETNPEFTSIHGTDNNKMTYLGAHGDILVNLFNLFGADHSKNRFFDLIPFVGAGYAHGYGFKDIAGGEYHVNTGTFNGGLLMRFRLAQALDLNLEIQGSALKDGFNGYIADVSYDGIAAATLGLTYKFNKRGWTPAETNDQSALIAQLNDQINSLRSDLNACLARPVKECPPCDKTVQKVVELAPAPVGVVRFALGSSKIAADQQINIYNAADYLKNNSGINLKVVGYADKKTGNPRINMKLSEQRAKAVTKMLVDKYGISSNRIETSWDGDSVQPYSTNEWNRVVIFVPQN